MDLELDDQFGIYALAFLNDKVYVGKTTRSFSKRWKEHIYELERGIHANPHMQNTWNLWGDPTMIVLETCNNAEEVSIREQVWIWRFDRVRLLNILVDSRPSKVVSPGPLQKFILFLMGLECKRPRRTKRNHFTDTFVYGWVEFEREDVSPLFSVVPRRK